MTGPQWLRLPSGRILNLATIAEIEPYPEHATVHFCAAGSDEVDGVSDVLLAQRIYGREDGRALLAHFEQQAVVVVAPTVAD
jgi:hypothetical protein